MSAFVPDAEGKERKDRVDALVHALHMVQTYAPVYEREIKPHERFEGMDSHQAWYIQTREYAKKQQAGEDNVEFFGDVGYSYDQNFY